MNSTKYGTVKSMAKWVSATLEKHSPPTNIKYLHTRHTCRYTCTIVHCTFMYIHVCIYMVYNFCLNCWWCCLISFNKKREVRAKHDEKLNKMFKLKDRIVTEFKAKGKKIIKSMVPQRYRCNTSASRCLA